MTVPFNVNMGVVYKLITHHRCCQTNCAKLCLGRYPQVQFALSCMNIMIPFVRKEKLDCYIDEQDRLSLYVGYLLNVPHALGAVNNLQGAC